MVNMNAPSAFYGCILALNQNVFCFFCCLSTKLFPLFYTAHMSSSQYCDLPACADVTESQQEIRGKRECRLHRSSTAWLKYRQINLVYSTQELVKKIEVRIRVRNEQPSKKFGTLFPKL